ncbi:helix-turn-helix domain-containing protein [Nocardia puris]|uniref:Helix-turn-helix protein n=1 Tax=Nocardia puris TaxID=208602 RepID=A0A366DBV1_9NOCA|nr:helix-turn-helix transcriptional regulator [Nocardia puris]RBO87542.1 helix-turn-helix protein [Nocardia puris]
MALAVAVYDARQAADLSIQEMRRRTGFAKHVYERLENNERTMSVEQLDDIATALDIEAEQLLSSARKLANLGDHELQRRLADRPGRRDRAARAADAMADFLGME